MSYRPLKGILHAHFNGPSQPRFYFMIGVIDLGNDLRVWFRFPEPVTP